jgi:hypothetical protein
MLQVEGQLGREGVGPMFGNQRRDPSIDVVHHLGQRIGAVEPGDVRSRTDAHGHPRFHRLGAGEDRVLLADEFERSVAQLVADALLDGHLRLGGPVPPICSILRPWYSLEAVQMGMLVNSVLETRNPLGQAEPGFPSENLRQSSTSEDDPRRLLNGTPSGELSER